MNEKDTTILSSKKWILPWVIAVAMFIDTLDSTIVSVAIPHIAESFNINPVDMKLALTSYLLSLAVFIPISGWLADHYGEKEVFIAAMIIFTTSSVLCALSTNLYFLVIARMIQGFGGALMMPVGRLIVLRNFTRQEFGRAMGLVVIPGLLGPALGPTLGGLILQVASWHWIFLVNVPIGIAGIIAAHILISRAAKQKTYPFNWAGFILFSIGLALITLALALLGDNFSLYKYSIFFALAAYIFLSLYWIVSAKQEHPLLDNELFKQKTFGICMAVSLLARPTAGALPFLVPLLLQEVWKRSALFSGSAFMFLAFGMMSTRFFLKSTLIMKYGYKKILLFSVLFLIFSSMNLCWFSAPQPFFALAFLLFVIGMAISQFYICIGSMSVAEVVPEKFSQATSISATVQQFSAGFGIALSAILLHLFSKITETAIFSYEVFFWTFIFLNFTAFMSLFFIMQLNPELRPSTVKIT